MTTPSQSQASQVFGEVGSDITDEERKAMKRGGDRIGNSVGRGIASRYETAITIFMLDYLVARLSEWAKTVTYEEILTDQARVASGQPSALFTGGTQQTSQSSDSSGGMGGHDPVAAVVHHVQTNPDSASLILELIQATQGAISRDGSDAVRPRYDESLKIISGQLESHRLVPGPNGTGLILKSTADALKAQENAEQALRDQRDGNHPNSLQQQINNLTTERDTLRQQAGNRPQLTADQASVDAINQLVTAVNGATGLGNDKKVKVSEIKPQVTTLASKAGVTPPR